MVCMPKEMTGPVSVTLADGVVQIKIPRLPEPEWTVLGSYKT